MTSSLYFTLFLVSLATANPTTPTPSPPNGIRQCARGECPVYTVLHDYGNDIYKRRVEPGIWATKVSPQCNRYEAISYDTYMAIHRYFVDNDIRRTTPIILEVNENNARSTLCPDESDQFPCCREIFTLAFFIPGASQATAPPPSPESGVVLVNATEPRDFYVNVYSGRVTVEKLEQEYNALVDFLKDQVLPFNGDDYTAARYDSSRRPLPHRSEIWVAVESGGSGGTARDDSRKRRALGFEKDIDLLPF